MKITLLIRFLIWTKGKYIGMDQVGNRYYQEYSFFSRWFKSHDQEPKHHLRRWVVYKEDHYNPSWVAPEWYGWLHFTTDYPLDSSKNHKWQKIYKANMTGTTLAYRPDGSLLNKSIESSSRYQYKGWIPPN